MPSKAKIYIPGIKVNITYKGHYGKVQSAMMTSAGTEDIADVAWSLLQSNFITGENVLVDGGLIL